MMQTLQVTVTVREAPFSDYVRDVSGLGCRLEAGGTGLEFADPWSVADELRSLLERRGWEQDARYQADGPTGTADGLWRGGALCLVSAGWEPSGGVQCPADRPIGECDLEPEQKLYTVALHCAQEVFDATPEPALTRTPMPTPTPKPAAVEQWQVRTLLAGPGSPGRLYALLTDISSGAWPAERVRFLVSDDYGATWSPFAGGLPAAECVRNVNLDYAAQDALYASTCQGLYRWTGAEWAFVSPQETGMVAIVYGQPETVWATGIFANDAPMLRSDDGGAKGRRTDQFQRRGQHRHRPPRCEHALCRQLLASGWSPDGLALYANLSLWVDKATGEVGPPAPYRSLDGGQTWEPLPIP